MIDAGIWRISGLSRPRDYRRPPPYRGALHHVEDRGGFLSQGQVETGRKGRLWLHIRGALPGSRRHDPPMSEEQRHSIENVEVGFRDPELALTIRPCSTLPTHSGRFNLPRPALLLGSGRLGTGRRTLCPHRGQGKGLALRGPTRHGQ